MREWLLLLYLALSVLIPQCTIAVTKSFVNLSMPEMRPTFVVNFDTGTVICQHSAQSDDLHLHKISVLCDGKPDCYNNPAMHDENFPYCGDQCNSSCNKRGACLFNGTRGQCYCDAGYHGLHCELTDNNECEDKPCHWLAHCQNTYGSYSCTCFPGFQGDGHECSDIDECETGLAQCPKHSTCVNLLGTYFCNCTDGFQPLGVPVERCADIDECAQNLHNCSNVLNCQNEIGSFKCVEKCDVGYRLIDGICVDIDECAEKLAKCDKRANCVNTIGNYHCTCENGFTGDGKSCTPLNDCSQQEGICDRHAFCIGTLRMCICQSGYVGDGLNCYDVDECAGKHNPCEGQMGATRCVNIDGGYICCEEELKDEQCIREKGAFCSGGCGLHAICYNETCQCMEGFYGDPQVKCSDINECENNKQCPGANEWCVNMFGGFTCCNPDSKESVCFNSNNRATTINFDNFTGLEGNYNTNVGGIQHEVIGGFLTINKKMISPKTASSGLPCYFGCPADSQCIDGICRCNDGFVGNTFDGCADIDECQLGLCDKLHSWCINLRGSFACCTENSTSSDCTGLEITVGQKDRLQISGSGGIRKQQTGTSFVHSTVNNRKEGITSDSAEEGTQVSSVAGTADEGSGKEDVKSDNRPDEGTRISGGRRKVGWAIETVGKWKNITGHAIIIGRGRIENGKWNVAQGKDGKLIEMQDNKTGGKQYAKVTSEDETMTKTIAEENITEGKGRSIQTGGKVKVVSDGGNRWEEVGKSETVAKANKEAGAKEIAETRSDRKIGYRVMATNALNGTGEVRSGVSGEAAETIAETEFWKADRKEKNTEKLSEGSARHNNFLTEDFLHSTSPQTTSIITTVSDETFEISAAASLQSSENTNEMPEESSTRVAKKINESTLATITHRNIMEERTKKSEITVLSIPALETPETYTHLRFNLESSENQTSGFPESKKYINMESSGNLTTSTISEITANKIKKPQLSMSTKSGTIEKGTDRVQTTMIEFDEAERTTGYAEEGFESVTRKESVITATSPASTMNELLAIKLHDKQENNTMLMVFGNTAAMDRQPELTTVDSISFTGWTKVMDTKRGKSIQLKESDTFGKRLHMSTLATSIKIITVENETKATEALTANISELLKPTEFIQVNSTEFSTTHLESASLLHLQNTTSITDLGEAQKTTLWSMSSAINATSETETGGFVDSKLNHKAVSVTEVMYPVQETSARETDAKQAIRQIDVAKIRNESKPDISVSTTSSKFVGSTENSAGQIIDGILTTDSIISVPISTAPSTWLPVQQSLTTETSEFSSVSVVPSEILSNNMLPSSINNWTSETSTYHKSIEIKATNKQEPTKFGIFESERTDNKVEVPHFGHSTNAEATAAYTDVPRTEIIFGSINKVPIREESDKIRSTSESSDARSTITGIKKDANKSSKDLKHFTQAIILPNEVITIAETTARSAQEIEIEGSGEEATGGFYLLSGISNALLEIANETNHIFETVNLNAEAQKIGLEIVPTNRNGTKDSHSHKASALEEKSKQTMVSSQRATVFNSKPKTEEIKLIPRSELEDSSSKATAASIRENKAFKKGNIAVTLSPGEVDWEAKAEYRAANTVKNNTALQELISEKNISIETASPKTSEEWRMKSELESGRYVSNKLVSAKVEQEFKELKNHSETLNALIRTTNAAEVVVAPTNALPEISYTKTPNDSQANCCDNMELTRNHKISLDTTTATRSMYDLLGAVEHENQSAAEVIVTATNISKGVILNSSFVNSGRQSESVLIISKPKMSSAFESGATEFISFPKPVSEATSSSNAYVYNIQTTAESSTTTRESARTMHLEYFKHQGSATPAGNSVRKFIGQSEEVAAKNKKYDVGLEIVHESSKTSAESLQKSEQITHSTYKLSSEETANDTGKSIQEGAITSKVSVTMSENPENTLTLKRGQEFRLKQQTGGTEAFGTTLITNERNDFSGSYTVGSRAVTVAAEILSFAVTSTAQNKSDCGSIVKPEDDNNKTIQIQTKKPLTATTTLLTNDQSVTALKFPSERTPSATTDQLPIIDGKDIKSRTESAKTEIESDAITTAPESGMKPEASETTKKIVRITTVNTTDLSEALLKIISSPKGDLTSGSTKTLGGTMKPQPIQTKIVNEVIQTYPEVKLNLKETVSEFYGTIPYTDKFAQSAKETYSLKGTTEIPFTLSETLLVLRCRSNDECGADAYCERRSGVCRCYPGFDGEPPMAPCVDIDECKRHLDDCDSTSRCSNKVGGFSCFCDIGYRMSKERICVDIDECSERAGYQCNQHAICTNLPGSYQCQCMPGYTGDGYTCIPVEMRHCTDEEVVISDCGRDHLCLVDENGRINCSNCKKGFQKEVTGCIDVNECSLENVCHENAFCKNLMGSYSCHCQSGYKGDGYNCDDIDECQNNPCHPQATCINYPGSYSCKCPAGWAGDGKNECINPFDTACLDKLTFCKQINHTSCLSVNFDGSLKSVCECEANYRYNFIKQICEDIDECIENRHSCDPSNSICVNTNGGYSCECAPGYEGTAGVCVDVDECERGIAGCNVAARCENYLGSVGCKCASGFIGDGIHCTESMIKTDTDCDEEWKKLCHGINKTCHIDDEDVPQCGSCLIGYQPTNGRCLPLQGAGNCANPQKNDCDTNAECIDVYPSQHLCICKVGYIGDGRRCDDVDECSLPGVCDPVAHCHNINGSFTCICQPGYYGNGFKCTANTNRYGGPNCHLDASMCHKNAECQLDGTCKCNRGYQGDGIDLCQLENEKGVIEMVVKNKTGISNVINLSTVDDGGKKIGPGKTTTVPYDAASGIGFASSPGIVPLNMKGETGFEEDKATSGASGLTKAEGRTEAMSITDGNEVGEIHTAERSKSGTVIKKGDGTSSDRRGDISHQEEVYEGSGEGASVEKSWHQHGTRTFAKTSASTRSWSRNRGSSTQKCTVDNHSLCHEHAECLPETGQCVCKVGYHGDGYSICIKEAENCTLNPSICDLRAKCDASTHTCKCTEGYVGNGAICAPDTFDCELRPNLCSNFAVCIGRRCICNPEYTGDGTECVTIEPLQDCTRCDSNAKCHKGACKCDKGYFGNGAICIADPEDCIHYPGLCHSSAICDQEKRRCYCTRGYTGNGIECSRIKLTTCLKNKEICDINAECLPTGACQCKHGFQGNGHQCSAVVAIKSSGKVKGEEDYSFGCKRKCASNEQCRHGQCQCLEGYKKGLNDSCMDMDECSMGIHDCHPVALCTNTPGSFICTCPEHYRGNGRKCAQQNRHQNMSVDCELDRMTLILASDPDLSGGRVFVRGQTENPFCSMKLDALLSNESEYHFTIQYAHCNVRFDEMDTVAITVVIQRHPMFITQRADAYDVRCTYPLSVRKVASHVDISEITTTKTIVETGLGPSCSLTVTNEQDQLIDVATVGQTLKLTLTVQPNETYAILPQNCFAINLETGELYSLTDQAGCAIDTELFPEWSYQLPSLTTATFRTFKWPDSSMIRFQCDCSACIESCPKVNCAKRRETMKHHRFRYRYRRDISDDSVDEDLKRHIIKGSKLMIYSGALHINEEEELVRAQHDMEHWKYQGLKAYEEPMDGLSNNDHICIRAVWITLSLLPLLLLLALIGLLSVIWKKKFTTKCWRRTDYLPNFSDNGSSYLKF